MSPRDTGPAPPLLDATADDTPTEVRKEDPLSYLIRGMAELTREVQELKGLVARSLEARMADEQAFCLARQACRDILDMRETCERNHARPPHPTNGASPAHL